MTAQQDAMDAYCDKHGHTWDGGHRFCLNCGTIVPEKSCVYPRPEAVRALDPVPVPAVTLGIPADDAARKRMPVFDGLLMYFPLACLAVSEVSKAGNDQHNPGEPLHWARGKSMDQMNTAVRHLMDHGMGNRYDYDAAGKCTGRHLAKAAWRVLAALQLDIEAESAEAENAPREG